jgi:hypothetical protein
MYWTFAGFHQQQELQSIEDDCVGRIIILILSHDTNHHATKTNDDDSSSECEIKYDRESNPIEDALPM